MSENEEEPTTPAPPAEEQEEESESDDADTSGEISEEEDKSSRESLVQKLEQDKAKTESPKDAPRKRHKEDFDWEEDIIGTGAFGEVWRVICFCHFN